MNFLSFLFTLLMVLGLGPGCAHSPRFKDLPPVLEAGDNQPSPVPEKDGFKLVEYIVTSSSRYPIDDLLDPKRIRRSDDVNAFDEVPASSWFVPRLGSAEISPETLVKGPEKKGPPQPPLTVVSAKKSGNSPGFIVKDSRGLKYLIKLDQYDYPAVESTVNYVVDRLFWGFGYRVSEDFIVHIAPEKMALGEGIKQEDVDEVYLFSYMDEDGQYRAVASLFLEGTLLGPISQKGTRDGDLNDKIPHENRRTLRGLRMFCAWLDNSGMRSDNSLDVYEGEPGKGHTVHYLLDFGEAFGIHGVEKNRPWDGFEHFFSLQDTVKKFVTLGMPVEKWERLPAGPHRTGTFDSVNFDPGKWKETTQFHPMRVSLPDDDYWAAKIIAAVTPAHLKALLDAAQHPEAAYSQTVMDVLLKRREKILRYAFGRVSPLELVSLESGTLHLKDLEKEILDAKGSAYRIRFLNSKGKEIAPALTLENSGGKIEIPVAEKLRAAKGYLIVESLVVRSGRPAPRPAQFHIRSSAGESRVSGILH